MLNYGGVGGGTFGGAGTVFAGTSAITGGSGVPVTLQGWGIPFILAPTGSMGNNGAITLGTALGRIYPKCFIYLPAGAVATSTPAAASWLYCEMSSTTVGVVYNNTYSSGMPSAPTSKTAFVTTGPGAYTGVTTEVTGPTTAVAGGVIGLNGRTISSRSWQYNNTAGNKTLRVRISGGAGTQILGLVRTTQGSSQTVTQFINKADQANQSSTSSEFTGSNSVTYTPATASTIDTTAAFTIASTLQITVATDYLVLEDGLDQLIANTGLA